MNVKMKHKQNRAQREIYTCKYLYLKRKKERKISIKSLIFYLRKLEKEEQIKPKTSRRNKIIEIKEKINKTKNIKPKEKNQQNEKGFLFEISKN